MEKSEKQNYVKNENVDFSSMKVAAALEQLVIDSISPEEIAQAQLECEDVKNCKQGNHPVSLSFEDIVINGVPLLCEVTGKKPKPFLPEKFRKCVMKSHHGGDHPGKAESVRRTASQYYWPNLKKEVDNMVTNCHPCRSTKPGQGPSHWRVPGPSAEIFTYPYRYLRAIATQQEISLPAHGRRSDDALRGRHTDGGRHHQGLSGGSAPLLGEQAWVGLEVHLGQWSEFCG